jgi:hypothetical protein
MSDLSIDRNPSLFDRIALLLRGPFDGSARAGRAGTALADETGEADPHRDDGCVFSEALAFWPHM